MTDYLDIAAAGIISPALAIAETVQALQEDNSAGDFDFDAFSKFLENIEVLILKDAAGLLQLKEKYGHEPFLDKMRSSDALDFLYFTESEYQPSVQYLPYMIDDLLSAAKYAKEILDKLVTFPIDAGQGIFVSFVLGEESQESKLFYKARRLIEVLFGPHQALLTKHKQIPVLVDFVKIVEELKVIFQAAFELKTPAEANATRASIVAFLATASEKAAKFLASLPQKMVQVVVNATKEITPGLGDAISWLFRQWWTWALIGVGVGLPILINKISLRKNPPETETTPKENPPLLLINPPPKNYDQLWKRAQTLERGLNESDFKKALSLFFAQHERYPDVSGLERRNGPPGISLAVLVGKVKDVTYKPPKGRKTPDDYKHKMDNTQLASDPTGKHLFFIGDTYMDRDGWLKR